MGLAARVRLGFGTHGAAETDPEFSRMDMITTQIKGRGITDPRVLVAMENVPRHEFVPPDLRSQAYEDDPLPIGHGQTISQPYIVALMTETLALNPQSRVLEIGTGSGYQAAVFGELAREVYSIEIIKPLAKTARQTLERLGYTNVHVRTGDGRQGWPEAAPFDAIAVTCAPDEIPSALPDQLREGGRLVIPVGPANAVQELVLLEKSHDGMKRISLIEVRFVPMTGRTDDS